MGRYRTPYQTPTEERRLYMRQHAKVRRERGRASEHECVECAGSALDWALRHNGDPENPQDYQPMCRRCHFIYDGKWSEEERAKISTSLRANWAAGRPSTTRGT